MVVSELMTNNPVSVDVSQPLSEALAMLEELAVRHLPVVEDGRLVGILSDRDLAGLRSEALAAAEARDPKSLPRVADVMSTNVISVDPETDAKEVIELMLDGKIGAIPVIDPSDETLMGIVSYVDLISKLADTLP